MDAVKTRPYRSPRRAQQAAATRHAVLAAARDLFVAQGYAATTVAQIAERAGVAVDYVRRRIESAGGAKLIDLEPAHFASVEKLLAWHPSEGVAALHAAAGGARGTVEARAEATTIRLTDHSAQLLTADAHAVARRSPLASALRGTASLADTEAQTRQITGRSEIDYERSRLSTATRPARGAVAVPAALKEARDRGHAYITRRRLAEITGVDHTPTDPDGTFLVPTHPAEAFEARA